MISVISFYLTHRALAERFRWLYMMVALLLSGVSHSFLVEGTVALEPARLFMIGLILHGKGYKKNEMIKKSLKYWLPFILVCTPVALYKLLYRPYGMYGGTYSDDMLFFLNWKRHLYYLAMLLGGNWAYFLLKSKYLAYLSFYSIISGLIAVLTTCLVLGRRYAGDAGFKEIRCLFTCAGTGSATKRIRMMLLLGAMLLVPTAIMYEYFGREIEPGFPSRHGSIMQLGNAIVIGGVLCVVLNKLLDVFKNGKQYIVLSMAALLGLGVFFNNLNLDLYFEIWEKKRDFFGSFLERFPTIPRKSDFLFDIQVKFPLGSRLAVYNAELPLNLLYAESTEPGEFRSHKVAEWYFFKHGFERDRSKYEGWSHLGRHTLNTNNIIVIRWQPGEFLVNREILEKYPNVEYRVIADKGLPLSPLLATYPLREKMNAFLGK